LEVADVLGAGRHDVRRVQIVPNPEHFADCDPVVALVAQEPVARICKVLVLQSRNWNALVLAPVFERHLQHWQRVVAAVSHVVRLVGIGADSAAHVSA